MKWEEICKYQSAINKHNAAADRWDAAATATQNLADDTDDAAVRLAWIEYTLGEGMVVEPEEAINQAKEMATLHRACVDKLHDIMCGR